ncbi:glycosyltransferase [Microbulbifer agarilyticus]
MQSNSRDATESPIIYLAPEIPGPSSTFVYNEIIELEKLGKKVIPFSIHNVAGKLNDQEVLSIKDRCQYLYSTSATKVIKSNFCILFRSPVRYLSTLATCLADALRCIRQPKVAIGLIYRFLIAGYMSRQLAATGGSHIHCHFTHIATDVAMYVSLLTGIPYSLTAHANDIFQRAYLLKQKGHRASFIATISEFNIHILESHGIAREKLKLVRCGVDASKFPPRSDSTERGTPITIGFLGRLVEKKGVDLLIHAVKQITDSGIELRVEIMGDGPLNTVLRAQAEQSGLASTVVFGGSLTHDSVSEWYEKIDFFVFPGKVDSHGDMDGIPVVLMEAMMRGVPVIATSVSGIPELVIDGYTGYLSTPDAGALAETIKRSIFEEDNERQKKTANAIARVETEFNLARNAKLLLDEIDPQPTSIPCPIS